MDWQEQVRQLPESPGVYIFRDAEDRALYVGKARNLKARVRSYFLEGRLEEARTGSLVREAARLETILVANEPEAWALENNLIKQHQPRFNILLRDDKTYPYITLTREKYPRVYVTRRLQKNGAEYFGPYFPAGLAWRTLHLIHKHFRVPSCRVDLTRPHPRPCLEFHIQRCQGPCVPGLTTDEQYQRAVEDVRLFLGGRRQELLRQLRRRRDDAAAAEQFEQAAMLRDLAQVVEDLDQKQKLASAEGADTDVIGFYREQDRAALNLFHLRGGRAVDRREYFWEELPDPPVPEDLPSPASGSEDAAGTSPLDPLVTAALGQLYVGQNYVPAAILLPADFAGREELQALLREQSGHSVELLLPRRGPKRGLVEWAARNARHSFQHRFRLAAPAARLVQQGLRDALALPGLPERIECFDISHFQGAETVAAMVVWEKGRMKKSDYRKFIIREVAGIDDFRAMEEVVTRRYRRRLREGAPLPDLVLIDGGIGQLHAAQRGLEQLGLSMLPIASLAKREEILYLPGREDAPVILDRHSPVLHLIQQVRDEAHRFAITFHRQRRGKAAFH